MLRKPYWCLYACIVLISACQKDTAVDSAIAPSVDDIQYYFDLFEQEGKKRGVTINLTTAGVQGVLIDLEEADGVAGKCRYHTDRPNEVLIDKAFWNRSSIHLREMIVFHELGHCSLGRGHDERQHDDGTCRSLMRSGINGCQDNYTRETRSAYLDELFAGSTN